MLCPKAVGANIVREDGQQMKMPSTGTLALPDEDVSRELGRQIGGHKNIQTTVCLVNAINRATIGIERKSKRQKANAIKAIAI